MIPFQKQLTCYSCLLAAALVSWGSLGVVTGLPTIADVHVPQPVLDGFEFDATLDFSWSAGSLPPQGVVPVRLISSWFRVSDS